MLILLKNYASTSCFQIISKCYIFCINFYITIFILLFNVFILLTFYIFLC